MVVFKTTFRNVIYDTMRKRGWKETEDEKNWDFSWVEKDWMAEVSRALAPRGGVSRAVSCAIARGASRTPPARSTHAIFEGDARPRISLSLIVAPDRRRLTRCISSRTSA